MKPSKLEEGSDKICEDSKTLNERYEKRTTMHSMFASILEVTMMACEHLTISHYL